MADYTPLNAAGVNPVTYTTSGAVVGGRLVEITGVGTVAETGAASGIVAGVSAHDAPSGGTLSVWPLSGVLHRLTAPAGTTAGFSLSSAAAGGVATGALAVLAAAGTLIGTAVTSGGAAATVTVLGK